MDDLKSQFMLDPKVTFLNHGSFGATPRPVFEAYQQWQRELERQPVEFLGRRHSELLSTARTALGAYLGTDAKNLVFVTNATVGLNIVARSINLGPNDQVLASDHEYGALDRTWQFLAQKSGFEYINTPIPIPVTTPEEFVDRFWRAVTPKTKVIFLSHITSPTALAFPIGEICARARQENILTIIDGAHAPGQIPINLDLLGADFYSGNLHKWLCAPKGSAFLYANPRVQHLIEPLVVSWGWQSDSPGASQFIDYLEWQGTRDISPFLSVQEAILFQERNNWTEVQIRCQGIVQDLRHRIHHITKLPPICPENKGWFFQMATCQLPIGVNPEKLKLTLYDQFHIEVPIVVWNNRPLIRFSIQGYNSEQDALILENALKYLLPNY